VDSITTNAPAQSNLYSSQLRADLIQGDWEGLYQTASIWLDAEPNHPAATFVQNIACLFTNPPNIIRNKSYLVKVSKKDWNEVLVWFKGFQTESDKHNPNFQVLDFILQPQSKKKTSIEGALLEHPNHAELLFLQAIASQDHNLSIEKLKLAVENKPEFPAAIYLLGIFSLELNKVEDAEMYLKQAIAQAPDFLEAHYQLGSLYSLYIPDADEQAKVHFEKVIELDPDGGAGTDARKVLDTGTAPQYGQRIAKRGGRGGGMSIFTILGISLLAMVLFAGPLSKLFRIPNPTAVGLMAGLFVFIGLYSASRKQK
jgi:tetratricopeptide (TPR) repeat protein